MKILSYGTSHLYLLSFHSKSSPGVVQPEEDGAEDAAPDGGPGGCRLRQLSSDRGAPGQADRGAQPRPGRQVNGEYP